MHGVCDLNCVCGCVCGCVGVGGCVCGGVWGCGGVHYVGVCVVVCMFCVVELVYLLVLSLFIAFHFCTVK